jgi:hypothetical protein
MCGRLYAPFRRRRKTFVASAPTVALQFEGSSVLAQASRLGTLDRATLCVR